MFGAGMRSMGRVGHRAFLGGICVPTVARATRGRAGLVAGARSDAGAGAVGTDARPIGLGAVDEEEQGKRALGCICAFSIDHSLTGGEIAAGR